MIMVIEFLGLFGSGVFNPAFATYRMATTEDGFLAQVIACWAISSRTVQPIGMLLGGALAAVAGIRPAMFICGLIVLASGALLPWRRMSESPAAPAYAKHEVPK